MFVHLRGRQLVAREQRLRIGAGGELARLLHPCGHVGRLVGNLVEVPRSRGIAGQVEDVDAVVTGRADVVVQDRGDQHHAVQLHAIVAEHVGQRRRARGAIRFADQELRRVPALIHRQVANDEAIEGAQVLIDAGEILRRAFAHGA